jgi:outer membrane protein assembly factor BamB
MPTFASLVLASLLVAAAPAPDDKGEALREAAHRGDVAGVRALLDAGTPVDAPARHGQTALMYAAEAGKAEVVRLLLDRGADVNARNRFFDYAPVAGALRFGHVEIARLLLEKGATDAVSALDHAVETDDASLAEAALRTGRIEPLDLAAARREAEKKGAALRALLASAKAVRPPRAPFAVDPARLRAYAVRYRAQDGEVTLAMEGDGLRLDGPGAGGPPVLLQPVGDGRFESADGEVAVRVSGRAGTLEWGYVNRAGVVTRLSVVTSDPAPMRTAAAAPAARAPRGAPRNWPQFRGTGASGIGDGQGAPLTWSLAEGRNVRFKTAIPGIGLSSPIVWGDRIFLTTAVSGKDDKTFRTGLYGDGTSVDDLSVHSFRLFALDKASGRVLWEREVHRAAPVVRRHLKSSLANATPATDGRRLVVMFGPVGVLAAYDMDGRLLWKRDVGVLDANDPQSGTAEWGHASSPILYGDLVIVQADRRKDSYLAAFSLEDGKEAWRVARDEPSTWTTPNVLRGPSGDELVTNGQQIRAYDPRSGTLLWTLGPNSEVVVATPVVGEGVAYVTAGYPPVRPVYAVRAGQRGDLTLPEGARSSAAVAWSHARGGTYIPTPVLYQGHLYTVNNNGILTSYRADTGEQVYQTRLGTAGASFSASPVAADGRLYFASETGEVYVLRAGPERDLLATNTMDEVVMSTPALSDGLLVVRTLGHLVGLAEGETLRR